MSASHRPTDIHRRQHRVEKRSNLRADCSVAGDRTGCVRSKTAANLSANLRDDEREGASSGRLVWPTRSVRFGLDDDPHLKIAHGRPTRLRLPFTSSTARPIASTPPQTLRRQESVRGLSREKEVARRARSTAPASSRIRS